MKNNRSNKRFFLGITIAVLVPLLLYIITRQFTDGHVKMPRYYIAQGVDSQMKDGKMVYDTQYHKVADLVLTNQLGKTVSLNKDLSDKILVIDFFFVNCPTVCPHLNRNMAYLQKAFKKNDSIAQFISITVNPVHDSFPVLRDYANRYSINQDHWWFLTGDKKTIYDYARNQLFVAATEGDGGADDFVHTQKIVLVDKHRHIRGYYDGLDSTEIKRCADDIILLWSEKHPKK
jgi:protein SCO1/2